MNASRKRGSMHSNFFYDGIKVIYDDLAVYTSNTQGM
jgi:hypothetical protein